MAAAIRSEMKFDFGRGNSIEHWPTLFDFMLWCLPKSRFVWLMGERYRYGIYLSIPKWYFFILKNRGSFQLLAFSESKRELIMKKLIIALCGALFISGAAMAGTTIQHSGGTDSAGCHNDRKTGGYHCH